MDRKDIAWDYLTDIQKAQLTQFYPELAEDKENSDESMDAGDMELR